LQASVDAAHTSSVHALAVCDEDVTLDQLRSIWEGHFLQHTEEEGGNNRFRDLIIDGSTSYPYFETYRNFDIAQHFSRDDTRYKSHGEMESMIARKIKEPFDMTRPPWEVILLDHYIDQEGVTRKAFIFRFHHAMADGFNMTRLFFQAIQPSPSWPSSSLPSKTAPKKAPRPGPLALAANFVSATVKILLCPQDPPSVLKPSSNIELSPVHSSWHMVCEDEISVAAVKAAAKAKGATVNDALMSALSGALRRVQVEKTKEEMAVDAQAVIWVSLRSPKEMFAPVSAAVPMAMDNANLGAVYVQLPISVSDSHDRLQEMSSRIRPLTASLEPFVANRVVCMLGALPRMILLRIWEFLAFKATVSCSNIVGPQEEAVRFGGVVQLRQIVFFTPPVGTLGIFSNLITVSNRVIFAMTADARLMDQAMVHKVVHEYFPQELRKIVALHHVKSKKA